MKNGKSNFDGLKRQTISSALKRVLEAQPEADPALIKAILEKLWRHLTAADRAGAEIEDYLFDRCCLILEVLEMKPIIFPELLQRLQKVYELPPDELANLRQKHKLSPEAVEELKKGYHPTPAAIESLFDREQNRLLQHLNKKSFLLNETAGQYLENKCAGFLQKRSGDVERALKEQLKNDERQAWFQFNIDSPCALSAIGHLKSKSAAREEAEDAWMEALFSLREYLQKPGFYLDVPVCSFLHTVALQYWLKQKRDATPTEAFNDNSAETKPEENALECLPDMWWADWASEASESDRLEEMEKNEEERNAIVECLNELEAFSLANKQENFASMEKNMEAAAQRIAAAQGMSPGTKTILAVVYSVLQKKEGLEEDKRTHWLNAILQLQAGKPEITGELSLEDIKFWETLEQQARYVSRYEVIEARYYEGLPNTEIALLYQTNANNCRQKDYQARQALKLCVNGKLNRHN